MKTFILISFIVLLSNFVFADQSPNLSEACRNAGGTPPGVKQATKNPPTDANHQDGVLTRGPISCFCGKKVFTPRPGDSCVEGNIHPAYENFCHQVKGELRANPKAKKATQCFCGEKTVGPKECCVGNVVSACAITFDPKTWSSLAP